MVKTAQKRKTDLKGNHLSHEKTRARQRVDRISAPAHHFDRCVPPQNKWRGPKKLGLAVTLELIDFLQCTDAIRSR